MSYDPDAVESQAESAKDLKGQTFEGEITRVVEKEARDIYGPSAENPVKEMIEVTVEFAGPDGEVQDFTDAFSLPKGSTSWANPRFKMGKFRRKYDEVPREGVAVECEYNEDGFFQIILEDQ